MKKIIVLFLAVFSLTVSCNREVKDAPACTEFNANCETKKEWCLVKPLSLIDTSSVDALGRKLVLGEWYLRNVKTLVLIPFADEPQDYGSITHHNLEIFEREYINKGRSDCAVLRTAKIDTIYKFSDHYISEHTYLIVAGILCTSGGEVKISSDIHTAGYKVGWVDYK